MNERMIEERAAEAYWAANERVETIEALANQVARQAAHDLSDLLAGGDIEYQDLWSTAAAWGNLVLAREERLEARHELRRLQLLRAE